MKSTITEDDLIKAVEHLAFEWVYFRLSSADKFRRTFPIQGIGQEVGYAQLIHFRVLLEFFYPGRTHEDDCTVDHFIRLLPEFKGRFPVGMRKDPEWRNEVKMGLDKLLAHMSAKRWREHRPDLFFYQERMKALEKVADAFINALPEPHRKVFDRYVGQWELWSFEKSNRFIATATGFTAS